MPTSPGETQTEPGSRCRAQGALAGFISSLSPTPGKAQFVPRKRSIGAAGPQAARSRQDSHVQPVASALPCPPPLQGLRANARGVIPPAASRCCLHLPHAHPKAAAHPSPPQPPSLPSLQAQAGFYGCGSIRLLPALPFQSMAFCRETKMNHQLPSPSSRAVTHPASPGVRWWRRRLRSSMHQDGHSEGVRGARHTHSPREEALGDPVFTRGPQSL